MIDSKKILSDIIVFMKYAKYLPELKRRETWEELITRNKNMHLKKFPNLATEIEEAYKFVYNKKILPSMRSLQFAGKPIELNQSRIFNCAYAPIDSWEAFSEVMFLLLGGTGVGFSVQKRHIKKLPEIRKPTKFRKYLVGDSIEGWSDAVKMLIKAYMCNGYMPKYDFRDIRPKGARLITSGGKAPGPEPLKECLFHLQKIFDRKENGDKLTSLEVHDIICYIADAVLAGGIRRAALISFFDIDDEEMLTCKYGNWWEQNPQRGRANNSAVSVRHKITKESFFELWNKMEKSKSGDPGFVLTNNPDWLFNPCQPKWAPILTEYGIRPLEEVYIGDKIWSENGWTTITNKFSTGIKKVYRYRTTAGCFYGTENHKIVSNGEKIEVIDADSIDILPGEFVSNLTIQTQDVMDGLVIGDGYFHKASNNLVVLCIGKDDQDYFNSEIKHLIKEYRPGIGDASYEITTTITCNELAKMPIRVIPDRFVYGDKSKVAGFLRGLYSANGSICGDRISLKTASSKLCEQLQILLSSLGIKSYYTTNKPTKIQWHNGEYESKESYDINITTDRDKFLSIIGFIQEYKTEKLTNLVNKTKKSNRSKKTYDIISIDLVSEEEVFDITVDGLSHTYWSGGCNVSNCSEASLHINFCNLVTINAGNIVDQEDFNERAKAASFISTLQASYTDFHYLRDIWKENTEKESLLGVSLTGIADKKVLSLDFEEPAKLVKKENERVAKLIGVNKAARTTLCKPEGTTSLVLGCSSGIHAWHSQYYIRRVRVGKNESIYKYLAKNHPELVEDDFFRPQTNAIITIPIKAPEGSITREESPFELLERVKRLTKEWIKPGHRKGDNTHAVSCTISLKDDEWESAGKWMWENRNFYNCISVLPFDGGTHIQAPFEEISEEKYNELSAHLTDVDLSRIIEEDDETEHNQEISCAGGSCEIK